MVTKPENCLCTQLMRTEALRTWNQQGLLASLVILTVLTLGGMGKDPRLSSALLERVGSWPGFTRGPALSVAVADHHAYVAIGEGGLAVLDVLNAPVRDGNGLRLSWLGAPGLRLQQAITLSPAAWEDAPNTEGVSSLRLSLTNQAAFFRLAKP